MKAISIVVIFVQIILLSVLSAAYAADLKIGNASTQVYFSPEDECTAAIVNEIHKSKSKIFLQAYSFSSDDIAEALIKAHKRGVPVEIILDKSNRSAKYSAVNSVAKAGIKTHIDAVHSIANNKVMIIDRETLLTGSFNFTKAAEERNAENLLIIKDANLATIYLKNWENHKKHSERY